MTDAARKNISLAVLAFLTTLVTAISGYLGVNVNAATANSGEVLTLMQQVAASSKASADAGKVYAEAQTETNQHLVALSRQVGDLISATRTLRDDQDQLKKKLNENIRETEELAEKLHRIRVNGIR